MIGSRKAETALPGAKDQHCHRRNLDVNPRFGQASHSGLGAKDTNQKGRKRAWARTVLGGSQEATKPHEARLAPAGRSDRRRNLPCLLRLRFL